MNSKTSTNAPLIKMVNHHLQKKGRQKKDLAEFMGMTASGMRWKLEHEKVSDEELEKIAVFLEMSVNDLQTTEISQGRFSETLEEQLRRIEESWSSLNKEKEKIIDQQWRMIETMQLQLEAALGKEFLSEEVLPVMLELDSKKIKRMPVHFASVPMLG